MTEKVAKTTASGLVYYDEPDPPKPPPEPYVPEMDEHDLELGHRLYTTFLALPLAEQIEMFARVKYYLMRRGGGGILLPKERTREGLIHEIASIFARNGKSQSEYT